MVPSAAAQKEASAKEMVAKGRGRGGLHVLTSLVLKSSWNETSVNPSVVKMTAPHSTTNTTSTHANAPIPRHSDDDDDDDVDVDEPAGVGMLLLLLWLASPRQLQRRQRPLAI